MKRLILGTALGRIGLRSRDTLQLLQAACVRPEVVGTLANDILAGTLACKFCKSHKTFIDVGAHIGSVVAGVLRHTPTARVIAFEAMREKVTYLRRKFPKVEFHCCALGESETEARFFVNTKSSGYSSLGRPTDQGGTDVVEILVPMKRLDDLVSSDEVDVIKIDVEGAELGVLRGADRLIARSRPAILFESGPGRDDGLGYSKELLWSWFAERDYVVLVPNRVAHIDPGLTLDCFLDSHLYPRRTTNYFAVPRNAAWRVGTGHVTS